MQNERDRPHPNPGQFIGSAVVVGASYGYGTTILRLQTFTGESIDYAIYALPDPEAPAVFRSDNCRPISVKIQHGGQQCSVIALTSTGTRRVNVTPGTALGLHEAGVHAVVEGGLQATVSCSNHKRANPKYFSPS